MTRQELIALVQLEVDLTTDSRINKLTKEQSMKTTKEAELTDFSKMIVEQSTEVLKEMRLIIYLELCDRQERRELKAQDFLTDERELG